MKSGILTFLGFVIVILLSSCGNVIKVHREDSARQVQWSSAVSSPAMMSLLAYETNLEQKEYTARISRNVAELPNERVELVAECRTRLALRGWRHTDSFTGKKSEASEGLYFDVWERYKPRREVVFAFRGTNFKELADWKSNLRWFNFFRWRPGAECDQYHVALREVASRHSRILRESNGQSVHFMTTGHSLGGGLAQHAFYALLPNMDRTVVFDTSPVTGYTDLSREQRNYYAKATFRETFPTYRVLRIHENGEILEYIRNFSSIFIREDSMMRVVEYETERGGNGVSRHSMDRITKGILAQDLRANEILKMRTEVSQ